MNRKMVAYTVGQIVQLEAVLLLIPLTISLYFRDGCLWAFLISSLVAVGTGTLFTLMGRGKDNTVFAKEGFVIVALAWLCMSAIGALPFVLSGGIPSYVDAFFETVSGFTTTGSSILTDVEALSKSLLFWRSFTHWIGGMGVLVLIMAIMPSRGGRSMHILKAEMPGPIVGKLVPRVQETAKILYIMYFAMSVLEILLLKCGNMSWFDSIVHTFGTAGTGGFGVYRDSATSFTSYQQWVIAIFMMLFGVNFNIYYWLLIRKVKDALSSRELWVYIGVVLGASALVTINIYPMYNQIGEAIRMAFFQVSSISTTTGFVTADYNLWPSFSKTVLFLLMFIGGCAGSTAGGLKVSRVVLLFKTVKRDLQRLLHPRAMGVIQLDGKKVDETVVQGTAVYFILYFILLAGILLLLSLESFDLETNLSAAVTCLNNVGPGLGNLVGPSGNFHAYSDLSKIVLSFAMLFGRLEIFPLLFILIPTTWTKK